MIDSGDPLLAVANLKTYFSPRTGSKRLVRAVDGVSLELAPRETLGIVGESGCGKSTLGRTVVGLLRPTAGTVRYFAPLGEGRSGSDRPLPGRVQMVFQDPYGSFNPRMRARRILQEPLAAIGRGGDAKAIDEAMEAVGLDRSMLGRYAHEFSGGQRQRLAIARAIVTRPNLIVADEPVSALDVSIQAQVLNLLMDLRERYGVAYLFISHDMAVVEHLSHRIAVMYAGEVVEAGPTAEVIGTPRHPYTQMLLASRAEGVRATLAKGETRLEEAAEAPSPLAYPSGCRFHPRCPKAESRCRTERPEVSLAFAGHRATCHLLEGG